jgi:hypothetical protein
MWWIAREVRYRRSSSLARRALRNVLARGGRTWTREDLYVRAHAVERAGQRGNSRVAANAHIGPPPPHHRRSPGQHRRAPLGLAVTSEDWTVALPGPLVPVLAACQNGGVCPGWISERFFRC